MVYISRKKISGGTYCYLVKSVRLPDGTVTTIQKLIGNDNRPLKELEREHADYFLQKEKSLAASFAVKAFGTDSVFPELQVRRVEAIRVDYKRLINGFSKEQLRDVFDRFTANFTYESNAIEGSSLTLKDVAIVMFENRSVENKDLREIYETRNSRKVVEKILSKKFKVREKDIVSMHKLLMENIDPRLGYKQFPNEIVGSRVKLTPPEKVKEEMGLLIEWYGKAITKTHPLKMAALFHGKFERIHPFADGNGRVGRFIINTILVNNGYPPLIIRKTQRLSYINCLEDFQNGYSENLERFFLEKYKKTFDRFFAVYAKYLK
ncbi:MAG: Fic family protein [Candidatus Diapherotrites archaeon]|nr:Fic family protein [Candidatus Diapherotrites archaeon]